MASSSENMPPPGDPPKIPQKAFEGAIGAMLGLALLVAGGRTYARFSTLHRLMVDDVFFYLANCMLIAGTGLLYADAPLIYLQANVQAGLQVPPKDIVSQLIRSLKVQTAMTVLLTGTIFSIKFSFLFFFRHLIWQSKRLMLWWWVILSICIPTAAVFMFSDFMACSYFDERILVECVGPKALSRQNAVFKASAILDIATDALVISVPVLLLWNVKVSLRRRLAIGGILCLSIFLIILAIIRISAGNISNGQVDSAWAIFWLQIEACVAIIVISVSAFRALFVAKQASRHNNDRTHGRDHIHTSEDSRTPWKAKPLKISRSSTLTRQVSFEKDQELFTNPEPVFQLSTSRQKSDLMSVDLGAYRNGSFENEVELPLRAVV